MHSRGDRRRLRGRGGGRGCPAVRDLVDQVGFDMSFAPCARNGLYQGRGVSDAAFVRVVGMI